jgi:hypothetical protein
MPHLDRLWSYLQLSDQTEISFQGQNTLAYRGDEEIKFLKYIFQNTKRRRRLKRRRLSRRQVDRRRRVRATTRSPELPSPSWK